MAEHTIRPKPPLPQRKSIRLTTYDYSTPGAYFVTICTHNRQCVLGEIVNGEMKPNRWGLIVAEELQRTVELRPYLHLDEHVVMPNHLHAILLLQPAKNERAVPLSEIIGSYKSFTTKRIRRLGFTSFAWQRGYYDHVIRGEKDLQRIREYVVNNPAKWEEDKNNPYRRVGAGR